MLIEGKDNTTNKSVQSKLFGIFAAGGFWIVDNLFGFTIACPLPEGGLKCS